MKYKICDHIIRADHNKQYLLNDVCHKINRKTNILITYYNNKTLPSDKLYIKLIRKYYAGSLPKMQLREAQCPGTHHRARPHPNYSPHPQC